MLRHQEEKEHEEVEATASNNFYLQRSIGSKVSLLP
jgi:hypothetical protein